MCAHTNISGVDAVMTTLGSWQTWEIIPILGENSEASFCVAEAKWSKQKKQIALAEAQLASPKVGGTRESLKSSIRLKRKQRTHAWS